MTNGPDDAAPAAASDADAAQPRAVVERHVAAFNRHDTDAVLGTLHPDAIWSTGQDTVHGRAALADVDPA